VLIKATRSRLHSNCVVSGEQTNSEDQLEPLKPTIMREAIEHGLDRIEEVNVVLLDAYNSVVIAFTILHAHTRTHTDIHYMSIFINIVNVVYRQRQR